MPIRSIISKHPEVNDDEKPDNEWISGPGEKITLKLMDFPIHLKLNFQQIYVSRVFYTLVHNKPNNT